MVTGGIPDPAVYLKGIPSEIKANLENCDALSPLIKEMDAQASGKDIYGHIEKLVENSLVYNNKLQASLTEAVKAATNSDLNQAGKNLGSFYKTMTKQ